MPAFLFNAAMAKQYPWHACRIKSRPVGPIEERWQVIANDEEVSWRQVFIHCYLIERIGQIVVQLV